MDVEEIRRHLGDLVVHSPTVAMSQQRRAQVKKEPSWVKPSIYKARDTGTWVLRYYQPWTGIMVRDFPTWGAAMAGYVTYVKDGWY